MIATPGQLHQDSTRYSLVTRQGCYAGSYTRIVQDTAWSHGRGARSQPQSQPYLDCVYAITHYPVILCKSLHFLRVGFSPCKMEVVVSTTQDNKD